MRAGQQLIQHHGQAKPVRGDIPGSFGKAASNPFGRSEPLAADCAQVRRAIGPHDLNRITIDQGRQCPVIDQNVFRLHIPDDDALIVQPFKQKGDIRGDGMQIMPIHLCGALCP